MSGDGEQDAPSQVGGDSNVRRLILSAAKPLRRAADDLRQAARRDSDFQELLAHLRSSEPWLQADRELLAELLAGELANQAGRPSLKADEQQRRRSIHRDYMAERTRVPSRPAREVVTAVAAKHKVSEELVCRVRKNPPADPQKALRAYQAQAAAGKLAE